MLAISDFRVPSGAFGAAPCPAVYAIQIVVIRRIGSVGEVFPAVLAVHIVDVVDNELGVLAA